MVVQRLCTLRRHGACGSKVQANEVGVRLHLPGHDGKEGLVIGSIVADHGR